jgi:hypothetical protein
MFKAQHVLAMPPLHIFTRRLRPPPIFQIGFNKCGTTSLHRFLVDSGLASAHWRHGNLARRIMARIDAGQDPIRDYPSIVGFTDLIAFERGRLIEPYKRFDYLHRWYPRAFFILNTRDREAWIASRMAHEYQKPLVSSYAECLAIAEAEVPDFWRAEWTTHHLLARAYFRSSPNFLEFDIERDDPQRLKAFLGRRYRQCLRTPFGAHNQTA